MPMTVSPANTKLTLLIGLFLIASGAAEFGPQSFADLCRGAPRVDSSRRDEFAR